MPEGHDTTIEVSNIMSFVLYTQILKQSVLKPASPGITLNRKVIGSDIHTSVYDKRDDFGFPFVNFPWVSGDIPRLPSYGIYSKPQSDIRCNRSATSPRLTIFTDRIGRNKVPDRSRRGCREVGD